MIPTEETTTDFIVGLPYHPIWLSEQMKATRIHNTCPSLSQTKILGVCLGGQ